MSGPGAAGAPRAPWSSASGLGGRARADGPPTVASATGQVVSFEVAPTLAGERLDRAVALVVGLSRSEASRLVDGGRVSVEGTVARLPSRRLRQAERVAVHLLGPGREPAGTGTGPSQPAGVCGPGAPTAQAPEPEAVVAPEGDLPQARAPLSPAPSDPEIVFVDDHLVVVDKPAGLVVHPGAGNLEGTLVQKLVGLFPDVAGAGPDSVRPGVVHRLDKGTSGLLVVARTAAAREALARQMAARTVARKYLAVVFGELEEDAGLVEAPLGRSPRERRKVAVVQSGRPARTHYRVVARSRRCFATSLLELRLETGRTHQVRAHLAAIGHAVLGDATYAGPGDLAVAKRFVPFLCRPWLHAVELGFVHPATGEPMHFASALPADLLRALDALGFEADLGAGERPAGRMGP